MTRKGDAPKLAARAPRRRLRFPIVVFLRVVVLGAAGIIASLIAIERAHQKAAEKARAAVELKAHAREERLLDAPTLEPESPP